ncbi:MAG: LacI family DNA-binding transcriptional regulator [Verrucomicrobiota bacterium]|jgi:DNA-binding LacI/PurR family transcriptional regulator
MVRLKDIAARGGVCVMTVSKALRGAPDVAEPTRARLRLLAQQMGYVPDFMAQSLRNRTTRLLGLVLSSVANPILARTVSAIQDRAHELGYDLLLMHDLNIAEREEACVRRLLSRRVDGLFLFPVYRLAPTAAIYEDLARRRMPVVILGHRAPFCSSFPNVETDDLQGSSLLTRHLLELGHKKIAFLCGPTSAPWAQERLEGYRRALREAAVEWDDALLFNAGATLEEGEKAALQILREAPSVTAVQSASDLSAMGAARAFLNHGLQIPKDLSVAGFGDIFMSELFRVPLTTVHQPKLRLGAAAMEIMQKLLRGEPAEARRLPAEIILRASTGPPKRPAQP